MRVGILLLVVIVGLWALREAAQAQSPPQFAEVRVEVAVQPESADIQVCFEVDRVGASPDPELECLGPGESETLYELFPDDYIIVVSNTSEVWGVVDISCSPRLTGTVIDVGDAFLGLKLDAGDFTVCRFDVEFGEVVPTATPTPTPTRTPTPIPATPVVVTATPTQTTVPATSTPQATATPFIPFVCADGKRINLWTDGCVAPAQQLSATSTPPQVGRAATITPPSTGDAGLLPPIAEETVTNEYPCGWEYVRTVYPAHYELRVNPWGGLYWVYVPYSVTYAWEYIC